MDESGHERRLRDEEQCLTRFRLMRRRIDHWRVTKRAFLEGQIERHGRLRRKAFPGRAAISCAARRGRADAMLAVFEKPGSLKIGHYVPGTRIPICLG